ncbi:hypothetical protein HELRODRAFT_185957 [Helobdella robusta]|uniref:SMB domain-containing protein n=1 Tax=Helobdella robusta TaxID=6412 RepID=T1FNH5_HELRO|nr:hypothetical protein HELRODRAFT_185957 [Helobdella robusta]ESN95940.1 hypothetical protein HELRODRAFT_185957 [Helobdella robusta]
MTSSTSIFLFLAIFALTTMAFNFDRHGKGEIVDDEDRAFIREQHFNRSRYVIREPANNCRELGKCCEAKDISCKVTPSSGETCYCDVNCKENEDCCEDYDDVCYPMDCELGDWSQWSECDPGCGMGRKSRSRPILTMPRNGGKPCGKTIEWAGCSDDDGCKKSRASLIENAAKSAMIVPAKFGKARFEPKYDQRHGIIENLHRHNNPNSTNIQTYCAVFEVTSISVGCGVTDLGKRGFDAVDREFFKEKFVLGAKTCVECQETAMKADLGSRCYGGGLKDVETRWQIDADCKGMWKLVSEDTNCSCAKKDEESFDNNFLFV